MKFSRKLTLIVFVVIVGSIGVAYAGAGQQIFLNATQTNVNGNLVVSGDTILGDDTGMSFHGTDVGIDILSDASGTFTFGPTSAVAKNDFQVNGDTFLGLGGGSDVNIRQTDAGIDLLRGTTSGFTFGDTDITIRDTLGDPRATFDDSGGSLFDNSGVPSFSFDDTAVGISGTGGGSLVTIDRVGETLILGDGPTRNHLFVPPAGDIIIDGPTVFPGSVTITGKLTASGGVDPPYVSFSSETHQTIRELALDVDPHEEVMIFWNTDSKQMEVYVVAQDKFYAMPLQEIEE